MSTANEATAAFLMGEMHGQLQRVADDFRIKVEHPEVVFDGTTGTMVMRFHDQTAIRITMHLEGAPYKTCQFCHELIYDDGARAREVEPHWLTKSQDDSYCQVTKSSHLPKEDNDH